MNVKKRGKCQVDSCGRPHQAHNYCSMHAARWRRHGHPGPAERLKGEYGAGTVTDQGYRVIHIPGHPLANAYGMVREHRVVLFDKVGPDPQPCHWCGVTLMWFARQSQRICTDHLDFNRLNNDPSNLVPACLDCNAKRREK